jgi:hypothetical protein
LKNFLKKASFFDKYFEGLNQFTIIELQYKFSERVLKMKEVLFREGEIVSQLFILTEGQVSLYKKAHDCKVGLKSSTQDLRNRQCKTQRDIILSQQNKKQYFRDQYSTFLRDGVRNLKTDKLISNVCPVAVLNDEILVNPKGKAQFTAVVTSFKAHCYIINTKNFNLNKGSLGIIYSNIKNNAKEKFHNREGKYHEYNNVKNSLKESLECLHDHGSSGAMGGHEKHVSELHTKEDLRRSIHQGVHGGKKLKGYQAAHSRMDNSIVAEDGNHGTAKEKYLDEWTKDIVGWKEPQHSMHKDYYQKLKLRRQNTFVRK